MGYDDFYKKNPILVNEEYSTQGIKDVSVSTYYWHVKIIWQKRQGQLVRDPEINWASARH